MTFFDMGCVEVLKGGGVQEEVAGDVFVVFLFASPTTKTLTTLTS